MGTASTNRGRRLLNAIGVAAVLLTVPLAANAAQSQDETFNRKTILDEAEEFFGQGAEGLGDVVSKAFEDQGRPNAYIKGEEVSGAVGVGVRYGNGTLTMGNGTTREVFWQGPTIGLDVGAEATKTFVLIYDLPSEEALFQRYPGVSGSLYFVAGVGMHYVERGDVNMAPIRFGVGWRQGANIGYMHFTRDKKIVPL